MFHAARFRLVAWNAGILTLILVVLGFLVYHQFATTLFSSVDAQLQNQKELAYERINNSGGDIYAVAGYDSAPAGYRILEAEPGSLKVDHSSVCPDPAFWMSCPANSMLPVSPGGLVEARSGATDFRTVEFAGEPWRVLSYPIVTNNGAVLGIVQIARVVDGEETSLNQLTSLLFLGGFLGIVLAVVAGLFLASRALVPLRDAFNRQRKFTADASHELRTPLALIRANAEMLERHGASLPPDDSELVTEIINETDHLNRLVGDLLTLARADAETITITRERVDLAALVNSVHEDLHLIAESRGIETQVTTNGPIAILGDPGRLRQLLLILLDNAIKYTDPGGRVTLALRGSDHRALLEVADTGVGIPAADLPRIFDRFYRVDQARGHDGGTGLGLAIARWIAQAHKGEIKVESAVGEGTRFVIDLPVASAARADAARPDAVTAR